MAAPILWAASLPLAKQCSPALGMYTTAALPYLASGLIGVLWMGFVIKKNPFAAARAPRFFHRLGLFTLYFILLYAAIGTVPLADFPIVILLNYLWPTTTLLFTLGITRLPFKKHLLIFGTVLVVIGIALETLSSNVLNYSIEESSFQGVPYLCAFAAAVTWGLYSALNRKWGPQGGGADAVPILMLGASFVLFMFRFYSEESSRFPSEVILPLLYLSCMPFIAHACWDIGTRLGNLPFLSLMCDFIPWAALTLTALYLTVEIGTSTWLSAVLIVTGAVISRYSLVTGGPTTQSNLAAR